jgi:hypothetical protein
MKSHILDTSFTDFEMCRELILEYTCISRIIDTSDSMHFSDEDIQHHPAPKPMEGGALCSTGKYLYFHRLDSGCQEMGMITLAPIYARKQIRGAWSIAPLRKSFFPKLFYSLLIAKYCPYMHAFKFHLR